MLLLQMPGYKLDFQSDYIPLCTKFGISTRYDTLFRKLVRLQSRLFASSSEIDFTWSNSIPLSGLDTNRASFLKV